jgi:hypothetical protein
MKIWVAVQGFYPRERSAHIEENQPQMNGINADQKREMDWNSVE